MVESMNVITIYKCFHKSSNKHVLLHRVSKISIWKGSKDFHVRDSEISCNNFFFKKRVK